MGGIIAHPLRGHLAKATNASGGQNLNYRSRIFPEHNFFSIPRSMLITPAQICSWATECATLHFGFPPGSNFFNLAAIMSL
jgi:hypothetical protein